MPPFVGELTVGESPGVNFPITHIIGWRRTPVIVGNQQYSHTVHDVTCQTAFNPAIMSYNQPFGQNPQQLDNVYGFETDAALRAFLEQPRRRFVYKKGGVTVLDSHEGGAPCDVMGGPFCTVHQIWSRGIGGYRTCNVNLSFKVAINESSRYTSNPSVILSHVYKQSHSVDADAFCVIATEGEVVFRRDRLELLNSRADNYRDWFLAHPIARGTQRTSAKVMVDTTGTRVRYRVLDTETALQKMIGAYGATRLEASQSYGKNVPGFEAAFSAARQFWKGQGKAVAGAIGTVIGAVFPEAMGGAGGGGGGDLGDLDSLKTLANALPTCQNNVTIRIWGNKNSTKLGLLQVCYLVIDVISRRQPGVFFPTKNFNYYFDLVGKFVQASVTFISGPVNTSTALVPTPDQVFLPTEEVPGVLTAGDFANPVYPADGGVRGSFIGAVVSQALSQPFAVPPAPLANAPQALSAQPP